MNLGLVTSYIIGGLLMLAILMMNINLSSSSSELSMSETTKERTSAIAEMITWDIPKIGYDLVEKIDPDTAFVQADSNKITFWSNVDNSGGVEQITWEFTTNPVTSTSNPNDFILRRVENGVATNITLGVTRFLIRYYDEYGDIDKSQKMTTPIAPANFANIRQIEIEIVCESAERLRTTVSADGRYIKSAWEKRFSPANLEVIN